MPEGICVKDYIQKTLKFEFTSCRIIRENGYKFFEFILPDKTKKIIPPKDVLYTLNNRHTQIQFDMVSLCQNLLHPIIY
jgi:hypothetical protein